MKRLFAILAAVAALFFFFPVSALAAPETSAAAYAIIDAESGRVIYSKNCDKRMPMASTTKIMTAAAVIMMEGDLEKTAVVSEKAAATEGSSAGLKAGDEITLRSLLYALMLESGNDAAEALDEFFCGALCDIMNIIVRDHLGLKNTNFENVHGLPSENHYSSARDMAAIMRFALSYSRFCEITGTKSASVKCGERTLYLKNHNRLLSECEGCDGGKTGYTEAAGRCLVSTAERGGRRLICVTLCDPDDWRDHKTLYDLAFSSLSGEQVFEKKTVFIKVTGSVKGTLAAVADGVAFPALYGETITERAVVPAFLYSPVAAGETVGMMEYLSDGAVIASLPIYLTEDSEPSFLEALIYYLIKILF